MRYIRLDEFLTILFIVILVNSFQKPDQPLLSDTWRMIIILTVLSIAAFLALIFVLGFIFFNPKLEKFRKIVASIFKIIFYPVQLIYNSILNTTEFIFRDCLFNWAKKIFRIFINFRR